MRMAINAAIRNYIYKRKSRITVLCKKVGGRHFGKFEYKQDKIDPKLGFAPPGAQ